MNTTLKKLLIPLMAISSTCMGISSTHNTNRSFLNLQPSRDGAVAKAFMPVFVNLKKSVDEEDKSDEYIDLSLMLTPFYNQTKSSKNIGKYLGLNNSNIVTLGNTGNAVTPDTISGNIVSIWAVIKKGGVTNVGSSVGVSNDGIVTLNPVSRSAGANIDVLLDLNSVAEGLSFSAGTAFVRRSNNLYDTITGGTGDPEQDITLLNFLRGTAQGAAYAAPLSKAILPGTSVAKAGFADIDLQLKYNIFNKERYNVAAYLEATLPTGNKPHGKFLFEPVIGTRSLRLGGGLCLKARVFKKNNKKNRVNFHGNIMWQHGFEGEETRVLDVKNRAWARYLATIPANTTVGAATITPAANILAQKLVVNSRNIIKTQAALCYEYKNIIYETGYHLFWKQKEDNTLKTPFPDASYYFVLPIASKGDNPTTTFQTHFDEIKAENLVINHDSQLWHSLFSTIGYANKKAESPWMIAAGWSYNFSNEQQRAPSSWDVYAKTGISF